MLLLFMYLHQRVCFTLRDNGWQGQSAIYRAPFFYRIRISGKSYFSRLCFLPLGSELQDRRTNLTLLAVAADHKVDTDALQENTGLWKCLLSASLC